MNPKQNPDSNKPERIAHAPYNFVPLPERAVPAEQNLPNMDRYYCEGDAEIGERYTGLIKCEIITESPVYVRGAIEPEAFKVKDKSLTEMNEMEKRQYARFFSPDNSGRPAIPGSSCVGWCELWSRLLPTAKFLGPISRWCSGQLEIPQFGNLLPETPYT